MPEIVVLMLCVQLVAVYAFFVAQQPDSSNLVILLDGLDWY